MVTIIKNDVRSFYVDGSLPHNKRLWVKNLLVDPRKNVRSNQEKHSNTSGAPIDGVILC